MTEYLVWNMELGIGAQDLEDRLNGAARQGFALLRLDPIPGSGWMRLILARAVVPGAGERPPPTPMPGGSP